MKHPFISAILLLAGTLFLSCHKSNLTYESNFKKSYNAWLSFKQTSDNSYRYMVTGGTWVGYGWQTIITVTEGKVTQRDYKLTPPPNSMVSIPADQLEWSEKEGELNTHNDSPAAEAITLDQVYEKARTEWLIKRKGATTFFETTNNGMISSCGYAEVNCMDDCFRGITIKYIQPL